MYFIFFLFFFSVRESVGKGADFPALALDSLLGRDCEQWYGVESGGSCTGSRTDSMVLG